MIISADLATILPFAYRELMFELLDDHTLAQVQTHYNHAFSTGSVIGWSRDKSAYLTAKILIEFESNEDAMMFAIEWL